MPILRTIAELFVIYHALHINAEQNEVGNEQRAAGFFALKIQSCVYIKNFLIG